jgi:release factor glutamine methyltransferase
MTLISSEKLIKFAFKIPKMSVKTVFDHFCIELSAIYDLREAENILTYVFEDVFNMKKPYHPDSVFDETQLELLADIRKRLLASEPWQYITGFADFYGLKFKVDSSVLIPRPETEELVFQIIQKFKNLKIKILDIGTGSGCIAVTLAKNLPEAEIYAVDISEEALKVASYNSELNNTKIHFNKIDILNPGQSEKLPAFDVIVSNPPYICREESENLSANVTKYEPHLALFTTDDDPLQFYKAIINFSDKHLVSGANLFFELSALYARNVLQLVQRSGFEEVSLMYDLQKQPRILTAKKL